MKYLKPSILFYSCLAIMLSTLPLAKAQQISFSLADAAVAKQMQNQPVWMFKKGDTLSVRVKYEQAKTMGYHKGYIFIDRKTHLGDYEEYANKKVWIELSPSVSTNISFAEDGLYRVSYANYKKEIIATDSLYLQYDQSVFFCKSLDANANPVDIQQEFVGTRTGLFNYYMVMKSRTIFDTHKLFAKVYQYNVGDYRTPIAEYWEHVNPNWKQVAFRGLFLKPGQYRLEITKANGEPFATGYFKLIPYDKEN